MVESYYSEELERVETEKIHCQDFRQEGSYCEFYDTACFHQINNRCFRAKPRTDGEFMEWMGDLCSDCNETECNDCDMYKNHFSGTTNDLYLHLKKPKRRTFFYI